MTQFKPYPKVIKPKKKERSMTDFFLEIWKEREHISEISDEPLVERGHPQWHWQFMHVLSKQNYTSLKHEKENVMLGTIAEHILQTREMHKTYNDKNWDKFYEKQDQLRKEYFNGKK